MTTWWLTASQVFLRGGLNAQSFPRTAAGVRRDHGVFATACIQLRRHLARSPASTASNPSPPQNTPAFSAASMSVRDMVCMPALKSVVVVLVRADHSSRPLPASVKLLLAA